MVFDWDGVAVSGRDKAIPHLQDSLSRLLDCGVLIVVVTGTHFGHLQHQLLSGLGRRGLENLFCCTNRGSEVYAFRDGGRADRVYLKQASLDDERHLDRTAIRLQKLIFKEFHLDSEIIFDRLNRRKVDLIPTPQWVSPPKGSINELLMAVEQRLGAHEGIAGLPWLVSRARDIAQECGLEDPRVTTDIKHIEIGLTDKSDSSRWILLNQIIPRKIEPREVCIIGDEFGMTGGVPGSDLLLCIPELVSSTIVSVGVEPAGTPSMVHHVPGGPEAFMDFLDLQLSYFDWGLSRDPAWLLVQTDFDPAREREMEALFTVGNGLLGLRGALEITIPASESDLYIAGVYDSKFQSRPYSELDFLTPKRNTSRYSELVSFPFPFRIRIKLNGDEIQLREKDSSTHSRKLDLGTGILEVKQKFQIDSYQVEIISRRLASLDDSSRIIHEFELISSGGRVTIDVECGIDFDEFQNRHPHLLVLSPALKQDFRELTFFKTMASGKLVAFGSRMQINGIEVQGPSWSSILEDQERVQVRRVLVVHTHDSDMEYLERTTRERLKAHPLKDFHRWIGNHRRAWSSFWRRSDLRFSNNQGLTESQRFNLYHLRIAAPVVSGNSIPARTLSGRGYEGHIFWDAEIFVLPFFALQFPHFARNLLEYRYRTLPGARRRATQLGFRGALFAWESTVDGEDETPESILIKSHSVEVPIFTGTQQVHVTADVAYGVWNYWYCTGDSEFMRNYGAEILFETARFWCSRVSNDGDQFHIDEVVGPDEYHHGVRDNAYTNWMARFNLNKALWARDWLAASDPEYFRDLCLRLGIRTEDFNLWDVISKSLYIPQPGPNGVIEQFEGFFQLKNVVLEKAERLKSPVSRLLDWQEVNASKICKQADVLMLPFLFPESFSDDVIRANYRYYEPITDHGSSLSLPVHAWTAARIGAFQDALSYYNQSVELDLFNLMQNTSLGVHAACMGGSWMALIFGLMGVRLTEGGPVLEQSVRRTLPREWGSISLRLLFREKEYEIEVAAA
ncbi:MAG: hypothetical protein KGQ59_03990 [Bdellovibrionales bacterium]|nr:hypothetical protein [Bdellovibrionales bacterium]